LAWLQNLVVMHCSKLSSNLLGSMVYAQKINNQSGGIIVLP